MLTFRKTVFDSNVLALDVAGFVQALPKGSSESVGGLEVDYQLILGWCLHRHVGGLLALENAVDVAGGPPELVDIVNALAVTIRPPLPERVNAVTARSISDASRTSIGVNSTPNDGATA